MMLVQERENAYFIGTNLANNVQYVNFKYLWFWCWM